MLKIKLKDKIHKEVNDYELWKLNLNGIHSWSRIKSLINFASALFKVKKYIIFENHHSYEVL